MYYHIIEASKDIYLYFNVTTYQLFISSPSEDIYQIISPKVKITDYTIAFFYGDCIYNLNINSNNVLIKYRKKSDEKLVKYQVISEHDYYVASKPCDRYKIFCEGLVYKKYLTKCIFNYNTNDCEFNIIREYFPITKEIIELNNYCDFNKMKKLLFWVADTIGHNGQSSLPQKRDAISLYKYAINNKYKLNCRGLAILLCELCLSIGLKARYIVCSQKELKYTDSHVVTICYDSTLKKWIYLDPCYKMYLTNSKGNTILSLKEFKEYIYENKVIQVNKEANCDGKPLDLNIFTNTMIKKLYKYSSPMDIYIGMDNDRDSNMIYLVPDENNYPDLNCTSDYEGFWD